MYSPPPRIITFNHTTMTVKMMDDWAYEFDMAKRLQTERT